MQYANKAAWCQDCESHVLNNAPLALTLIAVMVFSVQCDVPKNNFHDNHSGIGKSDLMSKNPNPRVSLSEPSRSRSDVTKKKPSFEPEPPVKHTRRIFPKTQASEQKNRADINVAKGFEAYKSLEWEKAAKLLGRSIKKGGPSSAD